jgi:predicted MPP superfamily phosphohydrolase
VLGSVAVFVFLYGLGIYYLSIRALLWLSLFIPALKLAFLRGLLFAVAFVLPILGRFAYRKKPALFKISRHLGNGWIILYMYALIFLGLGELLFLIGKAFGFNHKILSAQPSFIMLAGLGITATAIILLLYGLYHRRQIQVKSYAPHIKKSAAVTSLRVVLISDLHLGRNCGAAEVEIFVKKINALNADILCIAGDIFDSEILPDDLPAVGLWLKRIKTVHGVYACLGNHDSGKEKERMLSLLAEWNIRLLRNETVLLPPGVYVGGRDDGFSFRNGAQYECPPIKDITKTADKEKPLIMLVHNPSAIDEAAAAGADLLLCGHTHKGQVFPGNLITRIIYKHDYGLKWLKGCCAVVSSGIGVWGPPLRIGSDCEIVMLNVVFEDAGA